jgi:hypothetical protein
MVAEIEKVAKKVAFLSTPSVYFSLKNKEILAASKLFDVSVLPCPVCACLILSGRSTTICGHQTPVL